MSEDSQISQGKNSVDANNNDTDTAITDDNDTAIKIQIKTGFEHGYYVARKRTHGADGKLLRATCWESFHEIRDITTDFENPAETASPFPDYLYCTKCSDVVHHPNRHGNTNKLNRHKCVKVNRTTVTKESRDKLKMAAAGFISGDLRPYNVMDCVNFRKFCRSIFEFGQKHPNATLKDFDDALPCANTVKAAVHEICAEIKSKITAEIGQAINGGGLTVALDGWTDDQHHHAYLCIIMILAFAEENGKIKSNKYTLSVNEMPELVKSKVVITNHLFGVLESYGLSKNEVIDSVTAVHDRGGNILFGIKDEGIAQILCYAHMINNIVEAMTKIECVRTHITAASNLVSYLKKTGLSNSLKTTVKLNCPTRWNTVFMMFQSIVDNYEKIVEVITEKQNAQTTTISRNRIRTSDQRTRPPIDYIMDIDISTISGIAKFLKPFKDITVNIEGN